MRNIVPESVAPVKSLHIAVGLLRDREGRILISQRRPGSHGEGQWEFPGGKCEQGESVEAALKRELDEELGIGVEEARPFITVRHVYPEREVILDTWLVTRWNGQAHAREGQPIVWVPTAELHRWPLLEADVPIVNALKLPDLYLLTGPAPAGDFLRRLQSSLNAGVRLLRLRAPELNDAEYRRLAVQGLPLCRLAGAELLLDRGSPEMVIELGADGLHLTSEQLKAVKSRPLPEDYWLAGSCHSAAELAQLQAIGGDFAVLGPVAPTRSHAGAMTLGWSRFGEWVKGLPMPVYGLGGLGPADLPQAWANGARGVAAIRALWSA